LDGDRGLELVPGMLSIAHPQQGATQRPVHGFTIGGLAICRIERQLLLCIQPGGGVVSRGQRGLGIVDSDRVMIRRQLERPLKEWGRLRVLADVSAVIGNSIEGLGQEEAELKARLGKVLRRLQTLRGIVLLLQGGVSR